MSANGIVRISAASTSTWAGVIGAVLWPGFAQAHHSGAVFDLATTIELRGVVVDFKLRSPHASFVIDARVFVNGEPRDAAAARWEIESQSVPMLKTLGIDAQTFEPGDEIIIIAWPHRDPTFRFAHASEIYDAFGAGFVMASSNRIFSPSLRQAAAPTGETVSDDPAGASSAATGIARLVGRWQQPLISFATGGPNLPLNEAGMAAWRSYDRKQSAANTCEPLSIPDAFFAPFFLFDLRIDAQHAVLHHEVYDVVRTVPLRGARAVADSSGQFGRVSGRIDGDALIVKSRDYPASKWGLGIEEAHGDADVPSSARKTVIERFSVTPDGRTLVYEYTLRDPTYMTEPHSGRVELTRVPDDVPMYPYECDLESAAMWSRGPTDERLRVEAGR